MSENRSEVQQQWWERISLQEKSGKSIAAFCREHELRAWQFYEWKKRFRQKQVQPAAFVAVSLKTADMESPQPFAVSVSSAIELRHRRGWSLHIEAGFDADHLRRLLSVLDSAS